MQFFCTKNHYEQWRRTHRDRDTVVELLDLDRAVEVAREIFEIRQGA